MADFISSAKEKFILYWLLGLYAILFTLSALASCLLASLIGATWVQLDTQGKWMIVLAVFVNWSTIMLAFFNKAATRLQNGTLPISPDDQQLITTQTTVKTQTGLETKP